ncbi:peptidylprolyl isomerase [Parvicella tangerina]|uniref:peptidylprolyl isomerase n=1 Tax=Parvicella tangerina TaxID=2829795 RepID=A0A916NRU5_9FLAO|nr:peptidylprolyl isomerase [Parvicella tangerina]CAG5082163.1 hypothetical protein CRYO30217_01824 [Parvicella tangerina]
MRQICFFGIIVLTALLIGCSSEEEDYSKYTEEFEQDMAEKKKQDSIYLANLPKPDTNKITNENVVQKLTVFGHLNKENKVKISTKFGDIVIELFDDTPLHRANFLMLAKKGVIDSTIFYRVVEDFVVQGGSSDRAEVNTKMKEHGVYTIPDEIHPHHYHIRGNVAMAVNEQWEIPEEDRNKNSSCYNFYIVQRKPMTKKYLEGVIKKYDLELTEKEKSMYLKYGGTPHLDGDYTVFGKVVEGMSVVDKIAKLETDKTDMPLDEVKIGLSVVK